MAYAFKQSPNRSSRRGVAINAIILHFTAGASLFTTVNWFQNPRAGVSAHYVVGRKGEIVQMVHEHEKAWHAGQASLQGDPRVNSMSIGIEIVNWGKLEKHDGVFYCWPGGYTRKYDVPKYGKPFEAPDGTYWAPYTEEQVEAVIELCREIVSRYPDITIDRLVGHEDVAPGRKVDPGPALDMARIKRAVFKPLELKILPADAYQEDPIGEPPGEPSEEELLARQANRREVSWLERLWEKIYALRG